jgi:ATP/maltotriose-dependent transcriptional regulator MalT
MAEGTVTTHPRARSFIIKRPRLTKLLDESGARVLLLLAPAGYGKTTLAREWLEGKDGVAWYRGGPAMADVAALAAGIAEALTSAAGSQTDLTERVQILAARGQSGESLARAVAAADVTQRCAILAIDDCHHAANSEEATAFFNELLARTEFRIVATSRVRPPWVTPRMLVYGKAATIEMDELSFTDDEAREVLGPSKTQSRLLAEARGWPAVVGLAARGESAETPKNALELADLYDFFAEDLFETASTDLQRGLLLLALGADAAEDIARELIGPTHSAVLGEAVIRGFVGRTDSAMTLHPLLRGFLLNKLGALSDPDVDRTIRRVTAALAAQAQWDQCLTALEALPVADLIASILDQALFELLAAGRTTTVKRWLALAAANDVVHPIVLLAQAEIALRDGDESRAQVLGERAGELLKVGDKAAQAFLVAGRAAHLRDSHEAARANCKLAEELATSAETKAQAQWTQFLSALEERVPDVTAIAMRMRHADNDRPDHALRVQYAQAIMRVESEGDARAAAREFQFASGLLDHVRDPVLRTSFLNLYSYVMLVTGMYDEALDLAHRQIQEADANGLTFAKVHGLLREASAQIGLRNLLAAQRAIAELDHRSGAATDYVLRNTRLQAARLRIAMGDLTRAEIILSRRVGLSDESQPEQSAYHGMVLVALGKRTEGEQILRDAQAMALTFDAVAIADLGIAAVGLQHSGANQRVSAHSAMVRSIEKGRIDALVTACRIFPELARLGTEDPRVCRVLTEVFVRSRDIDLGRRAGLQMPREIRRSKGLSSRELEVYELLAQGRTNSEIAQTLFISESTTKVHVRHIFEKLGVHTRAEAARAKLDAPI